MNSTEERALLRLLDLALESEREYVAATLRGKVWTKPNNEAEIRRLAEHIADALRERLDADDARYRSKIKEGA